MNFDNANLNKILETAKKRHFISVDTEFIWRKTYYPELGLIQFGFSPEETFLIDTTAPLDKAILALIIEDPTITKVLHDAKQDLMIISQFCNASAKNIFDTRLAAGFCGMSSTLSLQNIIKLNLDIDLPKSETCTDWLIRPLSEKQMEYARDDVRYLNIIRQLFIHKAKDFNNLSSLEAEMAFIDKSPLQFEDLSEERWKKVKGLGKLTPKEKALLKELVIIREKYAQQSNIPRAWLLSDEILCQIAQKQYLSLEDLQTTQLLNSKQINRLGEEIIIAGQKVNQLSPQDYPQHFSLPITEKQKKIINSALKWLEQRGQQLHIDPTLFGNRHDISVFVFSVCTNQLNPLLPILNTWRYQVIGKDLISFINTQK